jgi:hypothetical protein
VVEEEEVMEGIVGETVVDLMEGWMEGVREHSTRTKMRDDGG